MVKLNRNPFDSADYVAPTSWRTFSQRQLLIFIFFSVTNIFAGVTCSLMAPFYPAVAEGKGLRPTDYGMVFGIFQLVVFVTCPLLGKYLYILGPRRTYIAGILVTGVSTGCFGALDEIIDKTDFLVFSYLVRIVAALGDSALVTANFSIVALEFSNCLATIFASLETFFGLGLIVGPTIGGILYEFGGFKLPFIFVGFLLAALGVVACIMMPGDIDKEEDNEISPGVLAILRAPCVSLAAVSILVGSLSVGFLSATLEPHIRKFGLTPVQTGLVFVIYGGLYALSAPVWGWLCDKLIGPFILALLGEIIIFVGFLFIGPAPLLPFETLLWLTCVGLTVYGIGLGATSVSSFIMALKEAIKYGFSDNVQTYGLVTALWKSSFALGSFIGPSLGGFLLDQVGFRWASGFVLGTQLAVIILFCGFIFKNLNNGPKKMYNRKELTDTSPLLSDYTSTMPVQNEP